MWRKLGMLAGVLAGVITLSAGQTSPADGEKVFRKCAACHSLEAGRSKIGPSLAGAIGRAAGSLPDFRFSSALSQSGLTWNQQTLDAFLADPSKAVPGTRMVFPGLTNAEDRAAVIAYLAAAQAGPASSSSEAPATTSDEAAGHTAPAAGLERDPTIPANYIPDLKYTLRSGVAEGRMTYIGFGGEIDGVVNPELKAHEGDVVQITLINGEGAEHDIVIEEFGVKSQHVVSKGSATTVAFRARAAGTVNYYCSLPGHRLSGMEGRLVVAPAKSPEIAKASHSIVMNPTSVPPPIGDRAPKRVRVELEAIELEGQIADSSTYTYWTFNGTVPGPFLRVRVGDTVEVIMKNDADSAMIHSVDFHGATGPGGGAAHLQVGSGRRQAGRLQGPRTRRLCLSLRDANGSAPHRQRHVRPDPGRARGRPAAGRP